MKIIVIQDRLRSGGTERQTILLTRAFAAAGHETELITFRPGGALAADGRGLPMRSLQPFDLGLDWFAPGLVGAVRRARPDIVLCMGRMANCYGGRIQRACPDAAVVCTVRTGKSLPLLFRRSLRQVRHILANSRETRECLIAREGVPPEKVSAIYNPLVFSAPTPDFSRDELRRRQGAGAGSFIMLCVAMFRPEKNQAELMEIAAGLPSDIDWQLWLAGAGPMRDPCERLARRLGVGARVRFLGFQSDPAGLYAAADVAVHASRSESLSNFLIEAQAAGLPSVACEAQGLRESSLPGRTGWVVPHGDRAAFRAALERLAAEPAASRRERAGEARAFASSTFDPSRQVAAHLELFKRLDGGG
jgi:glycosyltransferase involved in cell wall biosynthesis